MLSLLPVYVDKTFKAMNPGEDHSYASSLPERRTTPLTALHTSYPDHSRQLLGDQDRKEAVVPDIRHWYLMAVNFLRQSNKMLQKLSTNKMLSPLLPLHYPRMFFVVKRENT